MRILLRMSRGGAWVAGGATAPARARGREAGSVLIIVLWVAFGLVSITLYFAHRMSLELRAADHRVAAVAARHAIDGAARYVTNLLATAETPGQLPELDDRVIEDVPVGDSRYWLIGRDLQATRAPDRPTFGLVDECGKLNLNTATLEMLQQLPRMTPELAAAIIDWRDEDSEPGPGGAEDETYLRLNPPYRCKNAPFESVEELRWVHGMTLEILYGEDTNLNGVLDPNENDGDASPPYDNRDGRLDPGLIEYLTVHSRPATLAPDGSARVDLAAGQIQNDAVATLLQEQLGADRANEILAGLGSLANGFASELEFYTRSGMSAEEWALIQGRVYVSTAAGGGARVNVNTASEAVLACIPGIGPENAATLVAQRPSTISGGTPSIAWVADVLEGDALAQAGPWITGESYQFSVDIAALGPHGRGFQRVRLICDMEGGSPRWVARRDLTDLGWALGRQTREDLELAQRSGRRLSGRR